MAPSTAPTFPFHDQPHQEAAIEITERVASSLSIIGCLFVFVTFALFKEFRRPANRLIFYACLGNFVMNIGTCIGFEGMRMGEESPLCLFQAFVIQMFLPADALWNLSMAISVYLTVFRRYTAEQLKRLEWIYFVVNYGATFIVAFVYLFIKNDEHGKLYGPATLWCWVSSDWQKFRVALCYAPAWIAILTSFIIYALAGREIFRRRMALRALTPESSSERAENPFAALKTTEVRIVSEDLSNYHHHPPRAASALSVNLDPQSKQLHESGYHQYSVYIEKGAEIFNPFAYQSNTSPELGASAAAAASAVELEANRAAWSYTKCALLFFVSLLVTWLPSSIFRVYALVNHKQHFPLAYATGLVLPLMGFWNAVIYAVTSWGAMRELFFRRLFSGGSRAERDRSMSRQHLTARQGSMRSVGDRSRSRPRQMLGGESDGEDTLRGSGSGEMLGPEESIKGLAN